MIQVLQPFPSQMSISADLISKPLLLRLGVWANFRLQEGISGDGSMGTWVEGIL